MEERTMPERTTLELEGMSCAGCAVTIENALKKAEGVKSAQVNFAAEKAYVEYDPAATDARKLAEVVRSVGYDVKQERKRMILKIGGMSCASCAATVENALKRAEGVYSASVNIATEKASVEYDPMTVTREKFDRVVEEAGYEVLGVEGEGSSRAQDDDDIRKVKEARRRMWGAWALRFP